MDAGDDRIHEHRGGFGPEATRGEGFDRLADMPALGAEGLGEQAELARPTQEVGGQERERIASEAMEFAVGIDVALGRSHIGGLRRVTQPIRGEQGFVRFAFELKGVGSCLHQPSVLADRPDGATDPGGGFDHLHLRAGAGHGVGDGQSGRSGSQDDRVEHHGAIIDG